MAKELTDEERAIRRKARQRLIGALVLTLAAVVVLPMVLEKEPRPSGQDIELRIPEPDVAEPFVARLPAAVADTAPVAASAPAALPAATEILPPVIPAQSEPAAPAVVAPASPPESKPKVPEVAPAPETQVQATQAGAAEQYAVQVGAYSSAETARKTLAKLREWRFSRAYTESAGGVVRVRVGPYAERARAESVQALLEKHGLHPDVVTVK